VRQINVHLLAELTGSVEVDRAWDGSSHDVEPLHPDREYVSICKRCGLLLVRHDGRWIHAVRPST
jgi:hypothetical protein